MMDNLRQYLLSIIVSAVLCGSSARIIGSKGTLGAVIKMISGLIMTIVVISPIVKLNVLSWEDIDFYVSDAGENLSQDGLAAASDALYEGIKERTESYILDKAASMEVELDVDVVLSDDEVPVPCGVYLEGQVSPYVKTKLTQIIADDLGIPKEAQEWTG